VTVDAIKASSGRIRLEHFLLLQHEHRDTIMLHNNIVEGFRVARTWVPHEGSKGIERRGCMCEIKRATKHGDGGIDMPESTLYDRE
jgi:hypothetical protein